MADTAVSTGATPGAPAISPSASSQTLRRWPPIRAASPRQPRSTARGSDFIHSETRKMTITPLSSTKSPQISPRFFAIFVDFCAQNSPKTASNRPHATPRLAPLARDDTRTPYLGEARMRRPMFMVSSARDAQAGARRSAADELRGKQKLGEMNLELVADEEDQDRAQRGEDDAGGMKALVFRARKDVGKAAAEDRSDHAENECPHQRQMLVHDRFRDEAREQPDNDIQSM